ncbi:MAG: FxLYD domain-containing protein [Rhabdochlamydiaceae bacterium]
MKFIYIIPFLMLFALFPHDSHAEVYLNKGQYGGYFDSHGVYTVYGYVGNNETQPVIAKVDVAVKNGNTTFSESKILPLIYPSMGMMPFRFSFPQISAGDPMLLKPDLAFISTHSNALNLEVVYDTSLVHYPDGHLTGFIQNTGNDTTHNIDVYALVYDKENQLLGAVKSVKTISQILPGEKAEFVMLPDPKMAQNIAYYSCFVPGADNAIELATDDGGKKFYFSVLSIVYFSNQNFDKNNNSISLKASNPWQLPYYATFMFPVNSSDGDLKVFIDGKEVKSLVSRDQDTGNWHVAFNVNYGQYNVMITGFKPNFVPNSDEYFYVTPKLALESWAGYSTFSMNDSSMLQELGISGTYVPVWVKNDVHFVLFDNLPIDQVVKVIKYLNEQGVVK